MLVETKTKGISRFAWVECVDWLIRYGERGPLCREREKVKVNSKVLVGVTTKAKQFNNAALFAVEVGTTGLCGGDSGHGGRTLLRFCELGSTDMRVKQEDAETLTLVFGGDAELENLIAGLEFAVNVLKESKEHGTQDDLPTMGRAMVE
jgi:hypothetical protein